MGKTAKQETEDLLILSVVGADETIKKARKILNKAEKDRKASWRPTTTPVSTDPSLSEYDVEDYVVAVQEARKVLRSWK